VVETGASRLGGNILELIDVSLDLGGRRLIDNLTLRLVKGDRVGIIGPNGIGKTTLLRVVTGELEATSGKVVRGTQTRFAYFDQARTTLRDDWTVLDNVCENEHSDKVGAGTVTIGDKVMEMRAYLELFLFEGAALRRKVSALSGGERARVALALALKNGANVFARRADERSRHATARLRGAHRAGCRVLGLPIATSSTVVTSVLASRTPPWRHQHAATGTAIVVYNAARAHGEEGAARLRLRALTDRAGGSPCTRRWPIWPVVLQPSPGS
jgi:ABC-type iron transport system FetAB ATPase subunit